MKKIFLFLLLLSFVGCLGFAPEESNFKYEVTGTSGSYSVTIENVDSNVQQWSNVGNEWYYSWTRKGTTKRWLYISAQNNKSSGNVTVRIYKNGKIKTENTSYGGYSIATVSGEY